MGGEELPQESRRRDVKMKCQMKKNKKKKKKKMMKKKKKTKRCYFGGYCWSASVFVFVLCLFSVCFDAYLFSLCSVLLLFSLFLPLLWLYLLHVVCLRCFVLLFVCFCLSYFMIFVATYFLFFGGFAVNIIKGKRL